MKKVLHTYSEWCIWCGACVAIAPHLFKFNEKNKAFTHTQPINDWEWEEANDCIDSCPVEVISINEEE